MTPQEIVEKFGLTKLDFGHLLLNPLDDNITKDIRVKHVWEPIATQIVKDNVKPGDIFIDAGANIGYFSVLASFLGAIVFAFEPMPHAYRFLSFNCAFNIGRVAISHTPCALWDEVCFLVLNERLEGNIGNSTVGKGEGKFMCPAFTLDSLFNPVSRLFLKIDCEGTDYFVLKGAKRLVKDSQDVKVLIEAGGGNPYNDLFTELGLVLKKDIPTEQTHFMVRE